MKKGQVGGLGPLALSLVIAVIMIGLGSLILAQLLSIGSTTYFSTSTNNSGFNTTLSGGQTGLSTFSSFLPLIALAVVAMVVIGLFMGFGRKR